MLEAQKLDISQLVKTQYYTLLSKRLVEVNVTALDRAEVNSSAARRASSRSALSLSPSQTPRQEVDANGRVNVIRPRTR